ncbi:MAG TPA: SDR family oxidoreductase [Solirubrobacteraceae bacterium]|nr:SDR family oxidoreductase [Solirubrobacteraceae bacterium]
MNPKGDPDVLLDGKNAIIYGGGGAIGGAVARAFAREGAKVHLVGRTVQPLEAVADEIRATGGEAEIAQLDALDPAAVDAHADAVAGKDGRLDVSFCLISQGDVQGTPLHEMSVEDFMEPVHRTVKAMFVTSRAAARHMIRQRSGVILAFGGYGPPTAKLGGLQVAFGAVESLRRSLARELGQYGIRVLTLQTGGIPETIPEGLAWRQAITEQTVRRTMLGRAATLADVGNAAVIAASDYARTMTATALNITCGAVPD